MPDLTSHTATLAVAILVSNAFTLLSGAPLAAQELVPGVRIRSWVSPPGEWRAGTLIRYGTDSVVIQRCRNCRPEGQAWPRVTRVEVSEGKTWSGRNMAIGALVGGVGAAWIHERKVARDVARCHDGPCGLEAIEIPIAGLLGAATGAVLGAFWRVESWREVYGGAPKPVRN